MTALAAEELKFDGKTAAITSCSPKALATVMDLSPVVGPYTAALANEVVAQATPDVRNPDAGLSI